MACKGLHTLPHPLTSAHATRGLRSRSPAATPRDPGHRAAGLHSPQIEAVNSLSTSGSPAFAVQSGERLVRLACSCYQDGIEYMLSREAALSSLLSLLVLVGAVQPGSPGLRVAALYSKQMIPTTERQINGSRTGDSTIIVRHTLSCDPPKIMHMFYLHPPSQSPMFP